MTQLTLPVLASLVAGLALASTQLAQATAIVAELEPSPDVSALEAEITRLNGLVAERDQTIAARDETIVARESTISSLNQQVANLLLGTESLNGIITQRDQTIAAKNQVIATVVDLAGQLVAAVQGA